MGYAKLYFPNDYTVTVNSVLNEISKVVTGRSSNTANLVVANASLSTIINTSGRGDWVQTYPASNASGNSFVLTAAALNGNTKYCAIGSISSADSFAGTPQSSGARNYSGATTNGNHHGITMIGIQSATGPSIGNYTNPSLYCASGNVTATSSGDNIIRHNYIHLSWSSRHLMMFGYNRANTGSSKFCGVGVMEFTEDSVYNYLNTAPFAAISYTDALTGFETNTAPILSGASGTSMRDNNFQIFNYYNPANGVTTGVLNFWNNIALVASAARRTSTCLYTIDPVTLTRSSTGAYALPVVPIYWHNTQEGHPLNYMSDLCKVYLTSNQKGMPGDEVTIGASTYIYMPLGSTSNDGFPSTTRPAMLVLKA